MNVMMPSCDIEAVEELLLSRPVENMLEMGSGGSTLHFSKYVKNYYSVEHNREWFENVNRSIKEKQISNVKIILKEKKEPPQACEKPEIAEDWDRLFYSTTFKEYREYVSSPKEFGVLFDVVLIDGRARPECFKFLCENNLINSPGTIFVHDYRARDSTCARKHYNVIEDRHKPTWILEEGSGLSLFEFR